MFRLALIALAALFAVAVAPARQERAMERSLRLGGTPLALLAGRGSLWVLTCDRGCTGEARRSKGRIVRIDPRTARVVASAVLPRPGAIAVGASGIYATDFWRDTVRRIDPRTLRVVSALKLRLPFRFTRRDNAFLPEAIAVGQVAVWVASDRGALVRTDPGLNRAVASVRLPADAFGGMAVGSGGVWLAESLAGVYRIDPRTNQVGAKIRIPLAAGGFDAEQPFPSNREVLVVGDRTSGNVLTNRKGLARIDANHDRTESVTPLPSGPLAVVLEEGSLWVARYGSSTLQRVNPRTGRVVAHFRAHVGTMLAVAGGHIWTAFPNGTIRELS
jgi:streptogramin lyase